MATSSGLLAFTDGGAATLTRPASNLLTAGSVILTSAAQRALTSFRRFVDQFKLANGEISIEARGLIGIGCARDFGASRDRYHSATVQRAHRVKLRRVMLRQPLKGQRVNP